MATFLKEYPFMSVYYYWNVLTLELRTLMLSDVTRVKYEKRKKSEDEKDEDVETVGSIGDLLKG